VRSYKIGIRPSLIRIKNAVESNGIIIWTGGAVCKRIREVIGFGHIEMSGQRSKPSENNDQNQKELEQPKEVAKANRSSGENGMEETPEC
jgi:hypothetical protein